MDTAPFIIVIRIDNPDELKNLLHIAEWYHLEYTIAPKQLYFFIPSYKVLVDVSQALFERYDKL